MQMILEDILNIITLEKSRVKAQNQEQRMLDSGDFLQKTEPTA